jgi:cytochrome c peroxidase
MRRTRLIALGAACATITVAMFISVHLVAGQSEAASSPITQVYNPYPPGILPSDLSSEITRVQREVDLIEERALGRRHTLKKPILTGQPPILQNTGTEAIETLGELMLYDRNISPGKNQACASCHMPYAGFSGPIPSVNLTMVAFPGTVHFRAGKRTPQRHPYSPFFPVFQYNQRLFFGGNFWDSRATGYKLRIPDAEQAQGPPVDTQEMGFPDTACIAFRLSQAVYRPLFEEVWGEGLFDIKFPRATERICATSGGAAVFGGNSTPVPLSAGNRTHANIVYDRWAQSIDSFEQSVQVSPFSSKFDAFLAGKYTLTPDEMAGFKLFNGKGNCNSCHLDGRGTSLKSGQADNSAAAMVNPLFTCFGSANEGVPLNPGNAFYYQTKPDSYGFIANPYGFGYRDLGLGSFLRSAFGSGPNPNLNWKQNAPTVDGQMQVSSVRDVALTPPQCPTTEAPAPTSRKRSFTMVTSRA